ncbi:helix-turn-helix transcriptional regulator [Haloglycomyces albus]|uniref:helix-turn-helix transcriptional regulator n=1 Tax=Haloglycomyces albus TaxID=526067 RepID=UPI00146FC7C0|nr:LuxR C-terminal-related transcriptional regulator [Haloglycomyces albus]
MCSTDVDGSIVALDTVARPKALRSSPRPVFLITDREDGTALRDALSGHAQGVISTLNRASEITDTALRVFHDRRHYYDPQLLHAALGPTTVLGATAARSLAEHLTPREGDVLHRIVRGQATQHMATDMGVSVSTVRSHIQNVLGKLGVTSRLGAVAFALNYGLDRRWERQPQWI